MNIIKAEVRENLAAMPGVHLIQLACPELAKEAKPGQYLMVSCDDGQHILRRPLSVHQVSDSSLLTLLVRRCGNGTNWICDQIPGSSLDVMGMMGNGFNISIPANNILIIAGGLGIAPLKFLADMLVGNQRKVTLLIGGKTGEEILPTILNNCNENLNVIPVTENASLGKKGLVTDYISDYISDTEQVFACGPLAMYRTIKQHQLLKDKPCQISLEMRMACGHGVCYGCTIKTRHGLKQVCHDGPVFPLDEIILDEITC